MEYGPTSNEISRQDWDFVFYGVEIDDRSEIAISYVKQFGKSECCIHYMATERKIIIGNEEREVWADDIYDFLVEIGINSSSKILLESSSLGVAELLLLIQSFKEIGCCTFDVLYLEPKHYHKQTIDFTDRRQFDLSTSFNGFIAIPGHALSFESWDKAVVLCGFESERLGRAFDEIDLQGRNCQLVFGMPPYTVGWDMNSYANHLSIIEGYNIPLEFYYAGASNPLSVCEILSKVYNGLEDEQKLFILPLGTKPMSIGACVFKVSNDYSNLSILYDHPIRKQGRSKEISRWNLYHIAL